MECFTGELISFVQISCCVSAVAVGFVLFMKILFPSGSELLDGTADGGAGLVPKGSFGLPFMGETLQFAFSDPVAFCKPRTKKYGKVFKTNLLGTPTIIVTCPDLAKYVFTDRHQQFASTYPLYMEQLLGYDGRGFAPETERSLHKAAQGFFSPEVLRYQVADIEAMALDTLLSWVVAETVESVAKESIKFTLNVGIRLILGLEADHPLSLKLHGYYEIYTGGLRCLPIRLPGTDYSKALKAKESILDELFIFIEERASSRKGCPRTDNTRRDLLDVLMQDDTIRDGGSKLLARVILLALFGARDTVGYTITWAMKLLWESPEVLKAVTMENDDMIRRRKGQGEPLTWTDYKEMKYTSQVIQELLRISSIASGPTRKAREDVCYGGHAIPKDWNVMILLPAIHKNSEYFPDPMRFDPSRFEKPPKPNTFLPFGTGRHGCVGVELAKLEIFVFLHLLTTQFSWEVIGGKSSEILIYPWPIPKDGLPIKIRPRVPWDREWQAHPGILSRILP